MANHPKPTVLAMVERGTRLTLYLYDLSLTVPSIAAGDISRLAKSVNLLSQVLRQIGSRLREDRPLPSLEAIGTVEGISEQCRDVFEEIEGLVRAPHLHEARHEATTPQTEITTVSHPRLQADWKARNANRVPYLLGHMDALKLTLNVMLQTLHTAKEVVLSRCGNSQQAAYNAVAVERLHLESLIIEQQLALIRAYRLYAEFKRHVTSMPLSINGAPHSQAVVRRDELLPSPQALIPYQEPSLAQIQPSSSEAEDLSRVRRVSGPYVEFLLMRWTTYNFIEKHIQQQLEYKSREQIEYNPQERPRRNSNWQAPACDSDSEDEAGGRKWPPVLHLSTNDPILMHVKGDGSRGATSPVSAGLRPPTGPFSPQPSNSWGPTSGGYFPNTSPRQTQLTPGPSPLASPRSSFSSTEMQPPRPQTAFRTQPAHTQRPAIPWRLRINQNYWDYQDDTLVYSNTRANINSALKEARRDSHSRDSAKPITEIKRDYVSQDVIQDEGYEYTKVKRDRYDDKSKKTRLDTWYCIDGDLSLSQIRRLVEITAKMRASWGSDPEDKDGSSRGGGGPVMPPVLERNKTAPTMYRSTRDPTTTRSNTSSTSSPSDEEYKPRSLSHSRSRRRRDSATSSSSTYARHDCNPSRPRSYSSSGRKGSSGSSKAQTAMKIAAGAGGLATLLDGFGEGFGELLSHL